MTAQGVNSNDINFGPKIGPRCQIENWPIGRPPKAYAPWQNLPEFWPENLPENLPPTFFMLNELTPRAHK